MSRLELLNRNKDILMRAVHFIQIPVYITSQILKYCYNPLYNLIHISKINKLNYITDYSVIKIFVYRFIIRFKTSENVSSF